MANPLSRWLRRRRLGEPVVVVSGLPRSGTSMMMRMLETGGLEIMTDGAREADEDNPRGYWEYERVKGLETDPDKSWLASARGKVLKVSKAGSASEAWSRSLPVKQLRSSPSRNSHYARYGGTVISMT